MHGINTPFGQFRLVRNKTALAVLFLSIASFTNASLGTTATLNIRHAKTIGGPSVDSPQAAAFLSAEDGIFHDAIVESVPVMHDALAESFGQSAVAATGADMHDFVRRFSLPARGINWGILHPHNAVDVAGACGSSVYAVASGQVADVRAGWDGGYGNYVDIDHGNGIVTRYAHAAEVTVKTGQMVASGDAVARMGSTGNATGCHVHFEVLGSAAPANPFGVR